MLDNSRLARLLLGGVLIVLTTGLLLAAFGTPVVETSPARNLSYAKTLAAGCALYAMDHDGRFPVHLSELVPDYISDLNHLRGIVNGPDHKPAYFYDWLYFGAGFTDKHPPLCFSPLRKSPLEQRKGRYES